MRTSFPFESEQTAQYWRQIARWKSLRAKKIGCVVPGNEFQKSGFSTWTIISYAVFPLLIICVATAVSGRTELRNKLRDFDRDSKFSLMVSSMGGEGTL